MFRRSAGHSNVYDDGMSRTDQPGHFYFRLFFYFNHGNLLDLNYNLENKEIFDTTGYKFTNTAKNYLENNLELERSELLDKFVNLLSNINTYSPWYFSEISGLDTALQRNYYPYTGSYAMEEGRPQIQIKCLVDAYDNRIGTLLDLYREICFSQIQHKEIVPANLRKFDMGIYIFQNPTRFIHSVPKGSTPMQDDVKYIGQEDRHSFASLNKNGDPNRTSSKYIELHNCEIDINSSSTGYASLTNTEGFESEYTITLNFDELFEERYNEIMLRHIGDFVANDMIYLNADGTNGVRNPAQQDADEKNYSNISDRTLADRRGSISETYNQAVAKYSSSKLGIKDKTMVKSKFFDKITSKVAETTAQIAKTAEAYKPENLLNQAVNTATQILDSKAASMLESIYLGNLFTFSYANTLKSSKMQAWLSGDIINGLKQEVQSNTVSRTQAGWTINKKLPGYE